MSCSTRTRGKWWLQNSAGAIILKVLLPVCPNTIGGGQVLSNAFVAVAPQHHRVNLAYSRSCRATVTDIDDASGSQCASRIRSLLLDSDRRRYRRDPGIVLYSAADSVPQGGTGGGVVGAGMEAGEGDLDMAPVDLEQAMGSFSPEWANDTERVDPEQQQIAGSVILANQTDFPYAIDSFPPRTNSEVYYNGTTEKYWWNQDQDSVCVYVPVAQNFNLSTVEFVAKTKHVSLKLGGEEILSGTPFYRIDGYESLYVVDLENDPPYVQLELYKYREYQNWEDFLIEGSKFTPRGSG